MAIYISAVTSLYITRTVVYAQYSCMLIIFIFMGKHAGIISTNSNLIAHQFEQLQGIVVKLIQHAESIVA